MQKFVLFVNKIRDKHAKGKKYCKIRDHCHFKGNYRDAARRVCNYSITKNFICSGIQL